MEIVFGADSLIVDGTGTYTGAAFECEMTLSAFGVSVNQYVVGTPSAVWLDDGFGITEVAPESYEARESYTVCPASPGFWESFGAVPNASAFEAEVEDKNGIPSKRIDMTRFLQAFDGFLPVGTEGVSLERAIAWIADPGDWVSGADISMALTPDAAVGMFGIPVDEGVDSVGLTMVVEVINPDDPTLEVSPPRESTGPTTSPGYGTVEIDGEALPAFEGGSADPAVGTTAPRLFGADWSGSESAIVPDGRTKIVMFLAHWCPHCQAEVPRVVDWIDQGGLPSSVDFLSVSTFMDPIRPNWPAQDWLEREGWPLPVIVDDEASSVAAAFGVTSVPFYMVLDGDNAVLGRLAGEIGEEGLDDLVALALGN